MTAPLQSRKPLRLGLSGSSFIYAMPPELLEAAYIVARTGHGVRFDDRQNRLMASFMREMMRTISTFDIDAMECYHSPAWDNEPILEILLANQRVEFWSAHAPYGMYMDPSSSDPGARKGATEADIETVEVAARLGAKVVVVHPGVNIESSADRATRLRWVVEALGPVADFAGERGLCLAVEPLPQDEVGNTLDEVLWIVDGINRPNVGVNFDVNHLFPPERIPDLIRQAGELIVSVHISDQDGVERHWLPFAGMVDWRAVLAALIEVGYTGPLVYETHIEEAKNCDEVGRAVLANYQRLIALAPASTGGTT